MRQSRRIMILVVVFALVQPVLHGSIGIKVGLQRAEYEEINAFNFSCYKVGIFYSFRLGKNVLLQPELYFSHYGTRSFRAVEGWIPGGSVSEVTETLSYIEFPLLVKYTVPMGSRLKPVVFGGGYFSFRVSKNRFDRLVGIEGESLSAPYPYSTYVPYSKTDGGFVVGIGLEHLGNKTDMYFDLRVNIGVSDVYKKAPHLKKRNHSLAFMVGVGF